MKDTIKQYPIAYYLKRAWPAVAALPLIYILSRYNYNLFHSLADGLSIVIAACAFAVVWNSRRFVDNGYFIYTGIAFLFFAFLDLMHLLGNKNMGVFPAYRNLGPAFYIASRYVLSVSLLIAPFFIKRRLNVPLVLGIYTVATALIVAGIFGHVFPDCIIEGQGQTAFKIVSDYVICAFLFASAWFLFANRHAFGRRIIRLILYSILLSILTGLTFALYTDPFGITNMIAHLFQIMSFYLVYRAFIETSLTEPQEILFRKLQMNEEKLTVKINEADRANSELRREIEVRKNAEESLRRAREALERVNNELEIRVEERTFELKQAYETLQRETRERHEAEERLRHSQKMEALGTLTGGIAHDFNNILSAIVGFAEMLEDDLPHGKAERDYASHIKKAGIRGRDLVKQLLIFSRKTDNEKKPILLSSIVKESAKLLRASIPATVAINVAVREDSGYILADPVQIQQIILNLCTNAYHAMRGKGGSVDIELSGFPVEHGNILAKELKPGRYVRLIVRDTGTGMPPHIMDRIFDPFFTTKAAGEGTGLGLSVVMGIVKDTQGHITVDSREGKGTTFTIYFPLVESLPDADHPSYSERSFHTGSGKVLLVDDDPALLETGSHILTRLGYAVTCEEKGAKALELVEKDPELFDLVITDQTMPGMTGMELAKKVLAINPDIPIILCTGFSLTVDAESAKNAGIRGFMMKPLTKTEIARAVRDVLEPASAESVAGRAMQG